MEVLGAAASVAGLVQLAGKVTSLGYDYIGKVRRASDDIRQLVGEVSSLSNVLKALKEITDEFKPDATLGAVQRVRFEALQTLDEPLKECTLELTSLESDLRRKVEKKGWERRFRSIKWPFKEAENKEIMARIERLKGLIQIALDADHISLSKAIDEGVQNLLAEAEAETTAQDFWRKNEEADKIKEKRARVLKWLYPESHDTKHIEISNKRQKDTGKWFLRSPKLQKLIKEKPNSASGLLWGYGIPGAGKTFLSSLVIDHLREQAKSSNLDHGVAYVYFDYKEREGQQPVHVLGNILKQLASNLEDLPSDLEKLYDELDRTGESPTTQALYSCFIPMFALFSRTFLVFDAFDECDQESQRKELLALFHRMKADGASLFITSRQYPEDIQESFKAVSKIRLSAQGEDIKSYIEEKIEEHPRARRLVQQGKCKDRIISQMIDCANGMFLLVRFHIEHICQQTTANEIITALERLRTASTKNRPLDPTYDRVMNTINQQSETCADLAMRVLSWLVRAKRTLTVNEIQTAISIKPERYELDDLDLPDRATLLDVCGGLVTIDENSDIVRLAHLTVQEYILRKDILPKDAEFKLAMGCLTYLSFDAFSGIPKRGHSYRLHTPPSLYPFIEYSSRYMIQHLKDCDESLSKELVLAFIKRPGNFCSWYIAYKTIKNPYVSVFDWRYTTPQVPLLMASYIGNSLVVQKLLGEGASVSAGRECDGSSAIGWAAMEGHVQVVQLLIKSGANIDERYDDGDGQGWRTILGAAVHNRDESLVRLLLENGANTELRDERGRKPLLVAADGGYEEIVRLLLEGGANIKAQHRIDDPPLLAAMRRGYDVVARLLLEKGACAEPPNKKHEIPLFLAVERGQGAIVRLLLEKGACTEVTDKSHRTPLLAAVERGDKAVVGLLLQGGACTETPDESHRTPLLAAVERGDEAVVELLLQKGVCTEAPDGSHRTPLLVAVGRGDEAVVGLLLQKGACTETPGRLPHPGRRYRTPGRYYRTPLLAAVERGYKAVVGLLLQGGACTETPDESHRTPLLVAVERGDEAVVELLLQKGVCTETPDGSHRTPLLVAAERGHEAMVKMLLEKGACIEARGIYSRSSLLIEVEKGYEQVVRLSLQEGVDIEGRSAEGETPLLAVV